MEIRGEALKGRVIKCTKEEDGQNKGRAYKIHCLIIDNIYWHLKMVQYVNILQILLQRTFIEILMMAVDISLSLVRLLHIGKIIARSYMRMDFLTLEVVIVYLR